MWRWITVILVGVGLGVSVNPGQAVAQASCSKFVAAGTGDGNGTKTDPHSSLAVALSDAVAEEVLCVAEGTYVTAGSAFELAGGAILRGGYATDFEERDIGAHPTVLDGESRSRVLTISGGATGTVIEGVTIRNGSAIAGAGFGGTGWRDVEVTFQNVRFMGNEAEGEGGALKVNAGRITGKNILVSGNLAGGNGGGLRLGWSAELTLVNAVIAGNRAEGGGGGLYAGTNGAGTVENTIIWGNVGRSGADQVGFAQGSAKFTYRNSDVQGSGGSGSWSTTLGRNGGGNIDSDPYFEDPVDPSEAPTTNGSLLLLEGSPALNAGSNKLIGLSTDLDGEERTQEGTVDLGPYEGAVPRPDPRVMYVNRTSGNDDNAGDSWSSALRHLQTALARAAPDTEIWVATGVYYPDEGQGTAPDNPEASFVLQERVSIYGGFEGGEQTRSQRQPEANPVVLSGDLTQDDAVNEGGIVTTPSRINDGTDSPNALHVVNGSRASARTVLDGVVITAGSADDQVGAENPADARGGGLLVDGGSPTISDVRVVGNRAQSAGGGIASYGGGGPVLENVIVESNASEGKGGGIYNAQGSSLRYRVGTLVGNAAGGSGGGLYNRDGNLRLTSLTIEGNEADEEGGGVYSFNSNGSVMANLQVNGNRATSGGGLYHSYDTWTETPIALTNVTFSGNFATDAGGGIHNTQEPLALQNAILWGNEPSQLGGWGNPTVRNAIVEGGAYGTDADPDFLSDPTVAESGPTTDGDLRIMPGSPAVNEGKTSLLPADVADLDDDGNTFEVLPRDRGGKVRVDGSAVDLGAYEGVPTEQTIEGRSGNEGRVSEGTMGGDHGWRLVGPPFTGVEGQDLTTAREARRGDDQFVEFDLPSGHMLWTWNEREQAATVASETTSLENGKAAWVYFFDDKGSPDADPIGRNGSRLGPLVLRSNAGSMRPPGQDAEVEGLATARGAFHFLANPYPTPYDLEGLQDDGVNEETYQLWDPYKESWVNVAETPNDSDGDGVEDDVIAPWQGFLAKRDVEGGASSLTFSRRGVGGGRGGIVGSKSTDAGERYRRLDLRLMVTGSEGEEVARDEAISFLFRPASEGGVQRWNATKTEPLVSTYATLGIRGAGQSERTLLAGRGVPATLDSARTFSLSLTAKGVSGTATVSAPRWTNIPSGWTVTLVDTRGTSDPADDVETTLRRGGTGYTFSLPTAKREGGTAKNTRLRTEAASRRTFNRKPDVQALETSATSDVKSAKSSVPDRFLLRIEPGNALPVELTSFQVVQNEGNAVLTWSTAQETQNAGFVVQSKDESDGANFERIGYVEGAGTTSHSQSYRFTAKNLEAGTHTFRLKQIDRSGAYSFSPAKSVTVAIEGVASVSRLYPNPVQDDSRVDVAVRSEQNVRIALYDVMGRRLRVLRDERIPARESRTFRVTTRDLASGTYFVRVSGQNFTQTRRLTVVR